MLVRHPDATAHILLFDDSPEANPHRPMLRIETSQLRGLMDGLRDLAQAAGETLRPCAG